MTHPRPKQAGFTIPVILALALFLSGLAIAIATITISNIRFTGHEQKTLTALEAAEAGVNYYMWHLSHNTTDYCDGAATCTGPGPFGPYTHDYLDTDGTKIGTYTITITPPSSGSTVTTVQSVGKANNFNGARIILAKLGIPSFASYAVLTNAQVWFGTGENTTGPVHSNIGVHFDAVNNGPVTAAVASYIPSGAYGGNGSVHNGVWGNGGPTSQWQFPVPSVDFNQVTANISALKASATASGVYLAKRQTTFSSTKGYYLCLKNNGTIDIYNVDNEGSTGITSYSFVRNQAAPGNGVLYAEDNVWVDTTCTSSPTPFNASPTNTTYTGRLTIVSGRLPDSSSTRTSIKIIDNIKYSVQDGTVAIGLIAQKDVQPAQYAPNNLTIHGALLAQKGAVYMPNYNTLKGNLDFYGAIATGGNWTWSYCSGNPCNAVSGYGTSNNVFDTNLRTAPPPSFPLTGTYSILNWRELLYSP